MRTYPLIPLAAFAAFARLPALKSFGIDQENERGVVFRLGGLRLSVD